MVAESEKGEESYREIDEMDQFCQEFGHVATSCLEIRDVHGG